MATFQYLLDKVRNAPFESVPFKHVYIRDFFSPEHFSRITQDQQIRLRPAKDDRDLINTLYEAGYKEINFPGTTTDVETYLAWHGSGERQKGMNNDNCEGFGVTMRLKKPQPGSFLADLDAFMRTRAFWTVMAEKFDLDLDDVAPDAGIQKYLDGYEISPHPDIRRKALTFMININPAEDSENLEYHTHYMRFRPEHDHIRVMWRDQTDKEREWVPWSACETVSLQRPNNSIVIFRPTEDTLHAVRAHYDHLRTQRTQCYGNLWYAKPGPLGSYWSTPSTIARKVASIFR